MASTESLATWNRDLSKAIAELGSERFFPALLHAICRQVRADFPQVWLYHTELPPQCIYHEIPEYAQRAQIDVYLEGPYQEDPFYQISMRQPRGRFYRLTDLIDGALEDSPYYRNYYRDTATIDEVIFLARLNSGSVLNISLMRRHGRGRFDQKEFAFLKALSAPVAELMRCHSQLSDFSQRYMLGPNINDVIDHAFRSFASSMVSPREKGVLELMLRGYSSQASAEKLGIAVETLRRHRKSIYRKLDVSSQADLFSLFIASLPFLGQTGISDQLSVYMSRPDSFDPLV
jgi:DNA-binding CsgD family transcriptional regulator